MNARAIVRHTICIKKPGYTARDQHYWEQHRHSKRRSQDLPTNLKERIMIAHNATNIAQDLNDTPTDQGY